MKRTRLVAAGLLLAGGCSGSAPEGVIYSDFEATVSDVIPTVVTVHWTTDTAVPCEVRYGADLELVTPPESEASTEHTAILLGLEPATEIQWAVHADPEGTFADPGTQSVSAPQSVTTGTLPNTLPALTATGTHDAYTVTSVLGGVNGPAILSPEGKFVWFYEDTHGLDVYRARLSRDGSSVLYNAASVSGDPAEDSVLVRVSLDGTEVIETPVPLLAHDFVELDDGSIVAMAVEYRDDLRGDKLVSIPADDPVDGQTDLWTSWDCFDPAVDIGTDQDAGWTFANALDYDPAGDDGSGAFLLSLRNFSSITHIPRVPPTSGPRCDWTFGSTAATVTPDVPFLHEHQFELLHADDGPADSGTFLVFDNAGAGSASRAIEYSFDPATATASEVWTYQPDPALFTFVLGDVARLAGGDTVVDFAVSGELDRVTPDGDVAWRVNTALGYGFGFMTQTTSLYPSGQ